MPFGFARLSTLEAKLDIYEDLSKEMLDKLERAVSSIQQNTNQTAIILERHENRLDEGVKENSAIVGLIERVERKVDQLEKRVSETQKFMWMGAAGISTLVLIAQLSPLLDFRLTSPDEASIMKVERLG